MTPNPIDIAELRRRVALKAASTRSNMVLPPEMTIAPMTVIEARALLDEVGRLRCEVETLRRYGNKDCTAVADAELATEPQPFVSPESASSPHSARQSEPACLDHPGSDSTTQTGQPLDSGAVGPE